MKPFFYFHYFVMCNKTRTQFSRSDSLSITTHTQEGKRVEAQGLFLCRPNEQEVKGERQKQYSKPERETEKQMEKKYNNM